MLLKKSFFFFFFPFLILSNFIYFFFPFSLLKNLYFEGFKEFFFPSSFSFLLDLECLIFLTMVFFVTCLVVLYSEFYMEHYKNKKFFFLTLSFFLSMVILSCSGSIWNLMVGWDGLGISSLCLIMFYPSKISFFNSYLTFFFNRLGDLFLMLIFSFFLLNPFLMFYLFDMNPHMFCVLLMVCSFTKSAQFPLSSWLPAAMSAPTPISAMVHSSTLVTAGVFLLWKNFFHLENFFYLEILLIFSSLTFILGGLLGSMEFDLKKIVAFSTMSQISMIIFFISMKFLHVALAHMMFHALFKTLLFCSCGMVFVWIYSSQLSKSIPWVLSEKKLMSFLFLSVFCMTGLIFSSSFFSKDLVLELILIENNFFLFFLLILGSMLSLFYISLIMDCIIFSYSSWGFPSVGSKKLIFFFLFFFSLMSLICPYLMKFWIFYTVKPMVSFLEVILILSMLIIPFFYTLNSFKSKFSYLSVDLSFSKFFSFSLWGKFLLLNNYSYNFSDQMFFKSFLVTDFFYGFHLLNKFNINSHMFLFFLNIVFVWWIYTV